MVAPPGAAGADSGHALAGYHIRKGIVSNNTPAGVKLDVPSAWAPVIADFDTHQRMSGAAVRARYLYRAHLAQLARAAVGGPFDQTKASLQTFLMSFDNWAPSTLRSHRNTYVIFYDWALDEGLVDANPARKLPKVRHTEPKPRPASDGQYLAALTGADPRLQLMVHLANDLGLRATEIAHIHIGRDLRELGGRLLLTVHGKGGKDRTLPVPGLLGAMLSQLPRDWAFPSDRHPSGHLSAPYISKLLSRAMPEATGHMLRHRFASSTYQQEGDLLLVSQLLGHSNVAVTQGYVLADNMARMAAAVDRHARPFGMTG